MVNPVSTKIWKNSLLGEHQHGLFCVSENSGIGSNSTPEPFQPSKRTKSDMWLYFDFYKSAKRNLIEERKSLWKVATPQILWAVFMATTHYFIAKTMQVNFQLNKGCEHFVMSWLVFLTC